jgi:hypothetical protein
MTIERPFEVPGASLQSDRTLYTMLVLKESGV